MKIRGRSAAEIKRAELVRINKYYRAQEEKAKEEYKEANNYEIAYDWRNTKEAKRINRNRRRAISRARVKERENVAEIIGGAERDTQRAEDLGIKLDPGDPAGLFYGKLAYGSKASSVAVQRFKDAQLSGKRVVAVITDIFGNREVYTNESDYLKGLQALYMQSIEVQEANGGESDAAPQAEVNTGSDENNIYISVETFI